MKLELGPINTVNIPPKTIKAQKYDAMNMVTISIDLPKNRQYKPSVNIIQPSKILLSYKALHRDDI